MFRLFGKSKAEINARLARASAFDDDVARERGRLLAVRAMIENPQQRIAVEKEWGIDYAKARYPEVYVASEAKEVLKYIPRLNFDEPGIK